MKLPTALLMEKWMLVAMLYCASLVTTVNADTLELKDGREFYGEITENSPNQVTIVTTISGIRTTLSFVQDQILNIYLVDGDQSEPPKTEPVPNSKELPYRTKVDLLPTNLDDDTKKTLEEADSLISLSRPLPALNLLQQSDHPFCVVYAQSILRNSRYRRFGVFPERIDPAVDQAALASLKNTIEQSDTCTFRLRLLGDISCFGIGVPRDRQEALQFYLRAAEEGDAIAAVRAIEADPLDGSRETEGKLLHAIKKAVNANNALAKVVYAREVLIPKGANSSAIGLLRAMAQQGQVEAMTELAMNGESYGRVGRNELIQRAAELGDGKAIFQLGRLFIDSSEGCSYLAEAVQRGIEGAEFYYLNSAERLGDPAEITKATVIISEKIGAPMASLDTNVHVDIDNPAIVVNTRIWNLRQFPVRGAYLQCTLKDSRGNDINAVAVMLPAIDPGDIRPVFIRAPFNSEVRQYGFNVVLNSITSFSVAEIDDNLANLIRELPVRPRFGLVVNEWTNEAKNTGNIPLDGVAVTTLFFDSSGKLLHGCRGEFLENPLLPGQTSAFDPASEWCVKSVHGSPYQLIEFRDQDGALLARIINDNRNAQFLTPGGPTRGAP